MSADTRLWGGAPPAARSGGDDGGRGGRDDEALVEQALTLIARTHCGNAAHEAEARHALRQWQGQSAAHGRAAAQAARHWAQAGGVALVLAGDALDALDTLNTLSTSEEGATSAASSPDGGPARLLQRIDAAAKARAGRRRAARSIASVGTALALLLAVGWGGLAWWQAPVFEQSFAAARGQQLQGARLPDGTVLDIDADTSVQLRYTRHERQATLAGGQLRFDVAREQRQGLIYGGLLPAVRPFVVHTRAGRVEVLGTAFTVSDRGGTLRVVVERGLVRVTAGDAGPGTNAARESVELGPAQAVRIESDGRLGPVQASAGADAAAWREGWLAFDATPLSEAAAQFDAYRRDDGGALGGSGGSPAIGVSPQAAALRITGRFRANDPRAFAAALPGVLPVRVESVPGVAGETGRLRIERRLDHK